MDEEDKQRDCDSDELGYEADPRPRKLSQSIKSLNVSIITISGMPWSAPKISLRQTEPNSWQVILRAMRYDWPDEIKYHSLFLGEINASAKRADVINDAITNRQAMMHQQAERPRDERQVEMLNEETPGSSSPQDFLSTIPLSQIYGKW